VTKGGLEFLKETEKTLDCAGACVVPMFFINKPFTDGAPERDCVNAVIDDL
jgi:hypothetical protein